MKIGVKIFPKSREHILKLAGMAKIDFIEVMAVQGEDYGFVEELGLPVNIHCEHYGFGINLADNQKAEKNKAAVDFALQLADRFDSDFVVVHPGVKIDECSIDKTISFLKQFKDRRLLVENMCLISGLDNKTKFIGTTPKEIEKVMTSANMGLCLDFGHANERAYNLGVDGLEFIKQFMQLKPAYFHISDNNGVSDFHSNLGEGTMDIEALKRLIESTGNKQITIETNLILEKQINDIRILRE